MTGQMPASAVVATVDPQKNVAFDHAAVGGLLGLGPIVIHDLGRSSATSWGEIMHDSVRLPRNRSDFPSAHLSLIAPNARPDKPCQMTQADDARSDWQGAIPHNPKQLKTGGRERL